jgi:hypothetical protein
LVGFCWLDECPGISGGAPSPKVHDHDEGNPPEVSTNCTGCPARTCAGEYVNDAVGAAGAVQTTCTVTDVELETEEPPAVPLALTENVCVLVLAYVCEATLQTRQG